LSELLIIFKPKFFRVIAMAWIIVGILVLTGLAFFMQVDARGLSDLLPASGMVVAILLPIIFLPLWMILPIYFVPDIKNSGNIILGVTVCFVLLVFWLELNGRNYSLLILSLGYAICLAWARAGYLLFLSGSRWQYGLIDEGVTDDLVSLCKKRGVNLIPVKDLARAKQLDCVVADFQIKHHPDQVRMLADCELQGVHVLSVDRVYEAMAGRVSLTHLAEGMLDDYAIHPVYKIIKRLIDILVVIVSLPIAIPAAALTVALIKYSSPGPVIFRQTRVGQRGEPFQMLKFRSMHLDSEVDGAQFASKQDPRVTPVGQFIRKFRLDELPQFWNVLKGEMSLIGPRPEQVPFVTKFQQEIPYYGYRHLVKPGITGWAQVTQGYAADVESTTVKLEHDLYYVKHLSLSLDWLIIFKTVKTILTGFGAR
jgi:lipopolysaccharide/colanic/teichoic acid biosynthesis glycosyltransferase